MNGVHIKNGAVVILNAHVEETESPQFAIVTELFFLPTKKILLGMKLLEVVDYSTHFHSWTVTHTNHKHVADYKHLCSSPILHARTSQFCFGVIKLITMKYVVF